MHGTALCRTLSHSDSCRKRQCFSYRTRNRPAWPVCHGSTNTAGALIAQTDHAQQFVALHVHARKHNYLQQHDHHERFSVGNRVGQQGQHQNERGQQRCTDAKHNCIEQRNHRSPARTGKRRNHADQQAHRQEHRADDKQNLRQQHTACEHNRKRRHNQIENQKEHRQAEPACDLGYGQITVIVIFQFRLYDFFSVFAAVFIRRSAEQAVYPFFSDILHIRIAKLHDKPRLLDLDTEQAIPNRRNTGVLACRIRRKNFRAHIDNAVADVARKLVDSANRGRRIGHQSDRHHKHNDKIQHRMKRFRCFAFDQSNIGAIHADQQRDNRHHAWKQTRAVKSAGRHTRNQLNVFTDFTCSAADEVEVIRLLNQVANSI